MPLNSHLTPASRLGPSPEAMLGSLCGIPVSWPLENTLFFFPFSLPGSHVGLDTAAAKLLLSAQVTTWTEVLGASCEVLQGVADPWRQSPHPLPPEHPYLAQVVARPACPPSPPALGEGGRLRAGVGAAQAGQQVAILGRALPAQQNRNPQARCCGAAPSSSARNRSWPCTPWPVPRQQGLGECPLPPGAGGFGGFQGQVSEQAS